MSNEGWTVLIWIAIVAVDMYIVLKDEWNRYNK